MASVNEGPHSFTRNPHLYPRSEWDILTLFIPQPQRITSLWPDRKRIRSLPALKCSLWRQHSTDFDEAKSSYTELSHTNANTCNVKNHAVNRSVVSRACNLLYGEHLLVESPSVCAEILFSGGKIPLIDKCPQ